ncbi:MAG: EI24 domain-containing protein [Oculatellaceae cyanobacterium Prado106]|jgi:uncharacterized protein involved in cysteine biosynthesis|nr:EI24 domain-containing protein [Oculatellaceae cyanobacterium Prado106]
MSPQNSKPQPIPPVLKGPGSLIVGATYPLRALKILMQHPRLRGYVLWPILLNLLVGTTIYAVLLFLGFKLIDVIVSDVPNWTGNLAHLPPPHLPEWSRNLQWPEWRISLPDWLPGLPQWQISLPNWLTNWHFPNWLRLPDWQLPDWQLFNWQLPNWQLPRLQVPGWAIAIANLLGASFLWILRLILVFFLLLITGFIFLQFGVLLGAPWYGKLSEELELLRLGKLPPLESSLGSAFRDVGRAILYELKKLVLLIGIGLPLLLFNLIPGFGTAIATIGGITLTATIVCLDFFDSTLERRRLRFRQKLGVVRRSLPASASFGLVCLGLVSVPLINLLAIPVCVAAGTLFFCDRIHPWLEGNQ